MGRLDIDCSCTHIHWGRMRGVGRLDIDCSCTHIHWGRMRGVGRLDIDCSCTHINWGGCMNREDVLFRRGCDSLRKEHYITKEEGEYLRRER